MSTDAAPAPTAGTDATDLALIASARVEFERFGFRRANVEAIGRRAGVSRPTVYRRFPSKAELLHAVILDDVARFTRRFDAALFGATPARERIADTFVLVVRELDENSLLVSMRESEPELILAAFTFDGAAQFAFIHGLLVERVARFQELEGIDSSHAHTTAEVLLRLVYSVFLLPYALFETNDEAVVRSLAETYVAPMLGIRD